MRSMFSRRLFGPAAIPRVTPPCTDLGRNPSSEAHLPGDERLEVVGLTQRTEPGWFLGKVEAQKTRHDARNRSGPDFASASTTSRVFQTRHT